MAKEVTPKKPVRVVLDKKHWIKSLIIDSTLFTLGAGVAVISCIHQGKEPDKYNYVDGLATGADMMATSFMAGCILNDISKIRQISKAEKEKGCKVSTCSATLLCLHDSDGNTKSFDVLV